MKFWYNGKWNTSSAEAEKALKIGMIAFQNKRSIETSLTNDELAVIFEGHRNHCYIGFLLRKILFLPKPAKKVLFHLEHSQFSLKILRL